MMLKEKLLQDLKEAMKNKDVNRKNAVQMVRTGILQIEKDKGIEVTDEQILGIIAKEVKIRKDSLSEYEKADRQDLIEQVTEEIKALETYLPKQLSDEELTEEVKKIIAQVGATSMKDMGTVMKEAKKTIGARADGKRINEVVKSLLA
ncbi:MAG: GatB/YqeY domain-containing protein [Clostridia bacterium]